MPSIKKTRSTNQKETFMKGVMSLMISQVLIKLLGLIYRLYLTNRQGFGDEGNAIFGAGFQIYTLLLTLSSIGVPSAISKMVSEKMAIGDNKGAHKIFKIAFAFFAFIGLIGTLALIVRSKIHFKCVVTDTRGRIYISSTFAINIFCFNIISNQGIF